MIEASVYGRVGDGPKPHLLAEQRFGSASVSQRAERAFGRGTSGSGAVSTADLFNHTQQHGVEHPFVCGPVCPVNSVPEEVGIVEAFGKVFCFGTRRQSAVFCTALQRDSDPFRTEAHGISREWFRPLRIAYRQACSVGVIPVGFIIHRRTGYVRKRQQIIS